MRNGHIQEQGGAILTERLKQVRHGRLRHQSPGIVKAPEMTDGVASKLEVILVKLNNIKASVKNLETNLASLEKRLTKLEEAESLTKCHIEAVNKRIDTSDEKLILQLYQRLKIKWTNSAAHYYNSGRNRKS